MTIKRISSTELARSIGDILNRIYYRGEAFIVERNGKEVALLTPKAPPKRRSLKEVLAPWLKAQISDRDWGDLLEEIGREDKPLENPWE